MTLEGVRWGEFFISDVAEIISGRDIYEDERVLGLTPYIGASALNNGITHFVSNTNESQEAGCISVNRNGSVGYAFYHPYEALYSNDCRKLRLYHKSKYTAIFIATQITAQRGKYSYGYKMGTARLMRQKIQLPVDESGRPDYAFMESFMRNIEQRLIRAYVGQVSVRLRNTPPQKLLSLCGVTWRGFYLREVFTEIRRGKRLKTEDHITGNVPYVSSSALNNGVDDFISNTDGVRKFNNCMTIANSGSVGTTFYHDYEFIASDHVTALKAPHMSKYIYMFIAAMSQRLEEKYSFNREINETRINREKIMLPVTPSGLPDWQLMHNYMLSLETQHLSSVLTHFTAKLHRAYNLPQNSQGEISS